MPNPDLMDRMIRQHINDRIDHAAWLDDQGQIDLAQFVLDDAYAFAETVDREGGILWVNLAELR